MGEDGENHDADAAYHRRRRSARAVVVALAATLVLASCGSDTAADRPAAGERTMSPSEPAAGADSRVARQAVAALAQRLGVDEDEIAVDAVEEVTWNDGSLGCAEKGTMYTQALVDGSRITLRVGERSYEYHAGGRRTPFLCEEPTQ